MTLIANYGKTQASIKAKCPTDTLLIPLLRRESIENLFTGVYKCTNSTPLIVSLVEKESFPCLKVSIVQLLPTL